MPSKSYSYDGTNESLHDFVGGMIEPRKFLKYD